MSQRRSRFLIIELGRDYPGSESLPPGARPLVEADSLEEITSALRAKTGHTTQNITEHYEQD